jgi:hypothetical protein
VAAHISPTLRATLSVMTAMSTSGDLSSRARRAWRELRHACATTSAGMQMVPPRRLQPCLHGDGFGGVAKRPGSLARQLVAEVSAQS